MVGSFETINFALRPTKSIERKMIVEGLRAVARGYALDEYRYVGLASPYFQDFSLIHRSLDLHDMVSIEGQEDTGARMEFNRPFACITLKEGMTHDVLPQLTWERPAIVWLDYDDGLDKAKLEDLDLLLSQLLPGSVFLLTFSVHRDGQAAYERLASDIGAPDYPVGGDYPDVESVWKYARAVYDIVNERITAGIDARNGVQPPESHIAYRQMYHFRYRDSSRMLTLGGLLHYTSDAETILPRCRFEIVDELRKGAEALEVKSPKLTNREIRFLDRLLPHNETPDTEEEGIPAEEVEKYVAVYRYFPAFVEADF